MKKNIFISVTVTLIAIFGLSYKSDDYIYLQFKKDLATISEDEQRFLKNKYKDETLDAETIKEEKLISYKELLKVYYTYEENIGGSKESRKLRDRMVSDVAFEDDYLDVLYMNKELKMSGIDYTFDVDTYRAIDWEKLHKEVTNEYKRLDNLQKEDD